MKKSTKQQTKENLEFQIIELEERISPILHRLSNQRHHSFLQVKQDKRSIAVLRNKIKSLKKDIKLLGQLDLF